MFRLLDGRSLFKTGLEALLCFLESRVVALTLLPQQMRPEVSQVKGLENRGNEATSSLLLLLEMPGVTSSVLATSSDARVLRSFLFLT